MAPIDLRVDHVYLVSCKYLSDILFNASPSHVFDDLLVGARGSRSGREKRLAGDWYAEVAPAEYEVLYAEVRRAALDWDHTALESTAAKTRPRSSVSGTTGGVVSLPGLDGDGAGTGGSAVRRDTGGPPAVLRSLPAQAAQLSSEQREALGEWLRPGWPGFTKALYARLSEAVASASVRRWERAMEEQGGNGEAILWRLLRMGGAPYFVLGSSATRSLRLRIATAWDWRQQFQLLSITMEPQQGGQPRVTWAALVRDRMTHQVQEITGHIEIRWSHGRFGGAPEAKGYLDSPHHLVSGYYPLR